MDRLICGDAGFGKTEVALRAAFMCVMDGRQVAVLVPTTVLAEQHWNNFRNRFKDYPVRVEMVSRFRNAKENRQVIEDVRKGLVDIVIGTHRLLQSDVEFPKLGLLIIDEEHRFGVADKERIKRLRKLVEVLTMTATPIPRTLHMAMLGIRDLSVIQTPPADRQAVRTFVAHFDDGLIRDVIMRELNRGGQVFFVHNRVENIEYMARHLRALVPEAKMAIAHGQMDEHELEVVMHDFIDKQHQRAGLLGDRGIGPGHPQCQHHHHQPRRPFWARPAIPVARPRRTLQAKGLCLPAGSRRASHYARRQAAHRSAARTGRGRGRRRLQARDARPRTSRRGQSAGPRTIRRNRRGRLRALYRDDGEAIRNCAASRARPDFEPELRLAIPAYIPDSFVPDENERLVLYRRMARADSAADLDDLRDEMRDRFGPVPTLVENLIAAMNMRRQMREQMILSAVLKNDQLEIKFHADAPLETEKLAAAGRTPTAIPCA